MNQVVLKPSEPKVFQGPKFLYQRRLFSRINLSVYLREQRDLALRQFARGASGEGLDSLVERTYGRFQADFLWLIEEPKLQKVRELSDGSKEFEFASDFEGDPVLWECSPNPIDDHLPDDCEYSKWFFPPGETMQRPYGEIFRNQLILRSDDELDAKALEDISALVAWQEVLVLKANKELKKELYMLAQSYRERDPRQFEVWGDRG